ncbi:MAG: hypothetical protein ACI3W8_07495 [Oscillospiraceae bacterium]
MQLYLTATAEYEPAAARLSRSLAHMCYRVGAEGRLMRNASPKGGIMVLTDAGRPSFAEGKQLAGEVMQECRAGNFSGVAVDFESPPADDRLHFLRQLGDQLRYAGKRFFVPERYAPSFPTASILLCTALSGGDFQTRLKKAAREYGARRLALDVQWLRMDFPLPCPSGCGRPLTAENLTALMRAQQPVALFSEELCAEYFTYARAAEHHFVLFDTAESILKKLRFGAQLGCGSAFILYAEADDPAGLMQRIRKEKVL